MRLVRVCPVPPRGHVCPICMTDCDAATELKRRVRELERETLLLSFALAEERDSRIRAEVARRFPEERAA